MSSQSQWKRFATRTVLESPPWLSIEVCSVATPRGVVIDDWHLVQLQDYACILMRDSNQRFLVLEQIKLMCDGITLTVPGGYIEKNETPLQAAQRELMEETGYQSDQWTSLGQFAVDPNRGCGVAHLFLADNGRRVAEPTASDDEQLAVKSLSRVELEIALMRGEFKSLSWSTCIALGLMKLGSMKLTN